MNNKDNNSKGKIFNCIIIKLKYSSTTFLFLRIKN